MKNTKIAALAALTLALIVPAAAQRDGTPSMTGKHPMMGGNHMKAMDDMMVTMMKGLTPGEQKAAMDHMKHMSRSDKAVMMKCAMRCMNDKHKGMDMKKMDGAMMKKHMMSGLSKADQATMMGMMKKMSPDEMALSKKMMMNCCMHGMMSGKK